MNGKKTSISVVIPWKNRAEIADTLPHTLLCFQEANLELILVNYGGEHHMLENLLTEFEEYVRVIEVRDSVFNKPRALNLGAYHATSQYLLLLDADVVLEEFDWQHAIRIVDKRSYVTLAMTTESKSDDRDRDTSLAEAAYSVEFVSKDGRRAHVETKRHLFVPNARSCPGIVFLSKSDFVQVGGMHSELVGWGWEDIDLLVRLGFVGLGRVEIGHGLHLTHGNEMRSFAGTDPHENSLKNQMLCMKRYRAGNFLGSYDDDIARLTSGSLQPSV